MQKNKLSALCGMELELFASR